MQTASKQRSQTVLVGSDLTPSMPQGIDPGNYSVIACIANPDSQGPLFLVYMHEEWVGFDAEAYGMRFHEVPPKMTPNTVGVAMTLWDQARGVNCDTHVDGVRWEVLMEGLMRTILLITHNPSRSPRYTRGRNHVGRSTLPQDLDRLITKAPVLPKHKVPKPVVRTEGLRRLLVDRGLRPDLKKPLD